MDNCLCLGTKLTHSGAQQRLKGRLEVKDDIDSQHDYCRSYEEERQTVFGMGSIHVVLEIRQRELKV